MSKSFPVITELGPDFYDPVVAATFPKALPRFLNRPQAQLLGITSDIKDLDWKKHFCDFSPLPENLPQPLALRYHGHQFRHYNADLGDGRGFLFAQFLTEDQKLLDLGTKGSGQTPYSRNGDGRLTLKGAFREALATELLLSLGVNTSKTFCFFETGEQLERNDEPSPTRSAVLTRLSHGHIRIGTFQRLATLVQKENLRKLLDYCVKYYYPALLVTSEAGSMERASQFLKAVSHELANMTAQYMISGFVHGVLNSDNMNITGESFDYGPYRFMPVYNSNFTAAYFDHQGLYSYGRQPSAIFWNLQQLGLSLQSLFPDLDAVTILHDFGTDFSGLMTKMFFHRLNLKRRGDPEDDQLLSEFFLFLANEKLHFEQTFFDLFGGLNPERLKRSPQAKDYASEEFKTLSNALKNYVPADESLLENSYFQNSHPCTLLIDEIESIWSHIETHDDWSFFEKKISEIQKFRGIYRCYEFCLSQIESNKPD